MAPPHVFTQIAPLPARTEVLAPEVLDELLVVFALHRRIEVPSGLAIFSLFRLILRSVCRAVPVAHFGARVKIARLFERMARVSISPGTPPLLLRAVVAGATHPAAKRARRTVGEFPVATRIAEPPQMARVVPAAIWSVLSRCRLPRRPISHLLLIGRATFWLTMTLSQLIPIRTATVGPAMTISQFISIRNGIVGSMGVVSRIVFMAGAGFGFAFESIPIRLVAIEPRLSSPLDLVAVPLSPLVSIGNAIFRFPVAISEPVSIGNAAFWSIGAVSGIVFVFGIRMIRVFGLVPIGLVAIAPRLSSLLDLLAVPLFEFVPVG
jgi:hypothetical protein